MVCIPIPSLPPSVPREGRRKKSMAACVSEAVRKLMSNKSTSWKSLKAWQETDYPISPFLALHCLWHKILPYKGFVSRQPLSGFWPFGSGCHHADWLILGATVQDHEGQIEDEGEFLVPDRADGKSKGLYSRD